MTTVVGTGLALILGKRFPFVVLNSSTCRQNTLLKLIVRWIGIFMYKLKKYISHFHYLTPLAYFLLMFNFVAHKTVNYSVFQ